VGTTRNIAKRLRLHFQGEGTAWTKRHKPKNISLQIKVAAPSAGLLEDFHTLNLMRQHGIFAVRGGKYSNFLLPKPQILEIKRSLRHNSGLCLQCGSANHWASKCPLTQQT